MILSQFLKDLHIFLQPCSQTWIERNKADAAYFSFMPRPVYQSPIAANSPKPVQAEWYKFTRKKEKELAKLCK